MSPFAPVARALAQLDDPVFVGVVLRSVGLSAVCFVLLGAGCEWALAALLPGGGWWGWLAGAFGALAVGLAAVWLFLPVAVLIATLFVERVAAAVDRRFYPGLPPPRPASLAAQSWDGLALGGRVLALNLLALVLAPLLGVSLVLGLLVAGWAIGRGLFVAVAMRRMGLGQARALYAARRGPVVALGVLLALLGSVPLLNLLVPVLGVAVMVHVLNEGWAGRGARG